MISEQHFASEQIRQLLAEVDSEWANLLAQSTAKSHKLTQAHQYVDFNREVDEINAYIKESTRTASSSDAGTNVERCEVLQKKCDDFANDVTANRTRVNALAELCASLRGQPHPDIQALEKRLKVHYWC
jgi:spectrin alpha